jgi:hypothetical protein
MCQEEVEYTDGNLAVEWALMEETEKRKKKLAG